jgi:hypothetical protein
MTNEPVFRRSTGVVSASVDGDVVLMAPTDGRCYALRGSAEAVWDLLDQDRTIGALVEILTERFDVDAVRCTQDVSLLVADMAAAGVVEKSSGAST